MARNTPPTARYSRCTQALALALLATAQAATLGDLQIRSRLGQPLQAQIRIQAQPGDSLGRDCLSASLRDGGDEGSARRVYLDFTADKSGGGWLTINSDETLNEPIARLNVRLRCVDGGEVRRDYVFLLDPPSLQNERELPTGAAPARPDKPLPVSRADSGGKAPAGSDGVIANPLTVYHGEWISTAGETYASIAGRIFPGQPEQQRALVQQLRQLNADLPPRGKKPLADGVRLRLPTQLKPARPAAPDKASPAAKPVPQTIAARSTAPASPSASTPSSLTISATAANPADTSAEQAALRSREQELLDQASEQLAKLHEAQSRIDKLDKQMVWLNQELQRRDAARLAEQQRSRHDWLGLMLAALAGAGLTGGLVWLLRRQRRRHSQASSANEQLSMAFAPDQDDLLWHEQTVVLPPAAPAVVDDKPATASRPAPQQLDADMDVFILNSAAGEAAVLAAHGQFDRAIAILEDEIKLHPTSVVNWMQLLEILHSHRDIAQFIRVAEDFRRHFASESLWEKVRCMGAELAPDLALFSSQQAQFGPADETLNSVLDAHLQPDPAATRTDKLAEPLVFELDRSITAIGKPEALDLILVPPVPGHSFDDMVFDDSAPLDRLEQARRLIAGGEREAGAAILENILMQGSQEEKLAAADMLVRLTSPT